MTRMDILSYLSEHKEEFFYKFDLEKLGLFGSFERGEERKESDIDIIIELKRETRDVYRKKQALKYELESYFQRKVDIAREKYLRPLARKSILKEVTFV